MLSPDSKGVALIDHLKKVVELTKKVPPELQEYYDTPFPVNLSSYWNDFLELNRKRTRTEDGYNPITFVEIDAWARLNRIQVSSIQLDAIEMLDNTWLHFQAKKHK